MRQAPHSPESDSRWQLRGAGVAEVPLLHQRAGDSDIGRIMPFAAPSAAETHRPPLSPGSMNPGIIPVRGIDLSWSPSLPALATPALVTAVSNIRT